MEELNRNRSALIQCLSSDPSYIIEQAEDILTARDHRVLQETPSPRDKIASLLNFVCNKRNGDCKTFLELLRKAQDRYTQLENILSPNLSGTCSQDVCIDGNSQAIAPVVANSEMNSFGIYVNQTPMVCASAPTSSPLSATNPAVQQLKSKVQASSGSFAFTPVMCGVKARGDVVMSVNMPTPAKPALCPKASSSGIGKQEAPMKLEEYVLAVKDKRCFLKCNSAKLVQRVKNVDCVLDELSSSDLHDEVIATARGKQTPQEKMREILKSCTSESVAEVVLLALFSHQRDVMEELLEKQA